MLGCHVVVTGTAGAGKSTLAAALAEALGVVLLSKDRLKETIHQALPANGTAGSLRLRRSSEGTTVCRALRCLTLTRPASSFATSSTGSIGVHQQVGAAVTFPN